MIPSVDASYVVNKNGSPLMPCTSVIARLDYYSNKAKQSASEKVPFTIKISYQTTNYAQDITLGVDTGSGIIGSSAVNSFN